MIILEENFKWHLEAFASELFIYTHTQYVIYSDMTDSRTVWLGLTQSLQSYSIV